MSRKSDYPLTPQDSEDLLEKAITDYVYLY